MRRIMVLLFFAFASGASVEAAAQERQLLWRGDEVRLESPERRGVFHVVDWNPPTLTLFDGRSGEQFSLPISSVQKMEVRSTRRSSPGGFWRGARVGFVVGAASGALIAMIDGDDPPGILAFTATEKMIMYGVPLGVTGGVLGGLVGAAGTNNRWIRVIPGALLSVHPVAGDRVVVQITRAF